MDENIKNKIEELISSSKIFLFMKGNKEMPMCGFSRHVVEILNTLEVDFEVFNVLEDDLIRDNIKEYAQWPTFPQLWFNKELIGGCDIISEMFESGELSELLKNN